MRVKTNNALISSLLYHYSLLSKLCTKVSLSLSFSLNFWPEIEWLEIKFNDVEILDANLLGGFEDPDAKPDLDPVGIRTRV